MTAILWHSLLALCSGILLNAAPCVLPVIPFKVQAVMRDIGHSRLQRLIAAGAMWAGSLVFFAILGGVTIAMGSTWGAIFQSKIFIAVLTLLLIGAGLIMLVGWSVPMPRKLYAIKGQRYVGAALTGVLSAVLATPCGGPFLGAVLAYALTQPPLVSLMVFLSIGTGLVLPYVLLLTWPWLGRRGIKTGPWTVQVKQLLGFVLIAGGIFYAQSLIGPDFGRILWITLPVGLIVWALVNISEGRGWGQRALPVLVAVACIATAAARLVAAPATELDWQPYSKAAVDQARVKQKPVMLEFTAEWCLNCKVLEKTTYADQEVIEAAREVGILPLRVDMTEMDEADKQLMKGYGGWALPFLVLIDGQGEIRRAFTGLFGADTLIENMAQLNSPSNAPST